MRRTGSSNGGAEMWGLRRGHEIPAPARRPTPSSTPAVDVALLAPTVEGTEPTASLPFAGVFLAPSPGYVSSPNADRGAWLRAWWRNFAPRSKPLSVR